MKKGSIVLASLILLLLAALYIVSLPMASFTKTGAVGPGFIPRLYIYMGIVCAGCIILTALLRKKTDDKDVSTNSLVLKMAVIGLLNCIALPYLGYFISTLLMLMASMRVLGKTKWVKSLIISAGYLIVVYFVFVKLLLVPIPTSFLGVI